MKAPDFLYKYQRLTAHSLAAQLNESVWLAKPSTFNDPFDCALTLSKDSLNGAIGHVIERLVRDAIEAGHSVESIRAITDDDREAFEKLRDSLRNTANNVGVLSLAATPSHMLMWSHYADQHKGFCVEYDCREGTDLRNMAKPVIYLDEYPPLSIEDISGPNKNRFLSVALFSKAKHWEYEQEWRVVQAEGNRVFSAPSKVTAIIFGVKMSLEDRVMMKSALRSKPWIEFREAKLADGKFEIDIVPFGGIA